MKKQLRHITLFALASAILLIALSGCSSTQSKDGVIIEKKAGKPFWFG